MTCVDPRALTVLDGTRALEPGRGLPTQYVSVRPYLPSSWGTFADSHPNTGVLVLFATRGSRSTGHRPAPAEREARGPGRKPSSGSLEMTPHGPRSPVHITALRFVPGPTRRAATCSLACGMLVLPQVPTLLPSATTGKFSSGNEERPPTGGGRDLALVTVLLGATAAAFLFSKDDGRDIERLAPATRAGVVERTLEDLRTACRRDAPAAPAAWCRGQAQFLLLFGECEEACRATAREVLRVSPR